MLIIISQLIQYVDAASYSAGWNGLPETNYLNLYDGEYNSEFDKEQAVINKIYSEYDFIQIPGIDKLQLKYEFVKDKKYRYMDVDKFNNWFHNNEEENPYSDWWKFLDEKLKVFSISWCDNNGIKYTTKQLGNVILSKTENF